MEVILEFFRSDTFLFILFISVIILLALYIANSIKLNKLRKSSKEKWRNRFILWRTKWAYCKMHSKDRNG